MKSSEDQAGPGPRFFVVKKLLHTDILGQSFIIIGLKFISLQQIVNNVTMSVPNATQNLTNGL